MTAPPLWRQLQLTAEVIGAVRNGESATPAISRVEPALRAGVQSLAFAVLRSLARAQALRSLLVSRTPAAHVDSLLCTALALGWREQGAPYSPFTLVNQTVEAAKRSPGMRAQAHFINACLRRFLREREALVQQTEQSPQARWNLPRWWIERLQADHPAQWQGIVLGSQQAPPMMLRVNASKTSPQAYLQRLQEAGIEATAHGEVGIRLMAPLPVQQLPGFFDGMVSVQDAAAQMAAPLLLRGWRQRSGLRILDACAAPGGKTAHLLETLEPDLQVPSDIHGQTHVLALDIDGERCQKISEGLQRLGLQATVLCADASQPDAWWDGEPFDAILLDAPCTASGIVRRHPDIAWLRRANDVMQLAAIQSRLLGTLWRLLKPQGRLLYCTCSVFKAEGQDQIETFLAHNTEARLLPSPGHLMPSFGDKPSALTDNGSCEHDGFYYALLEKVSA
jgi:16S rRNA (cytosine967-C5)-methyltransferase